MKRISGRQWSLKPQDLAMAFKLVALRGRWLPYAALGEAMHLSRFEAHAAVQRLMAAGLVVETQGRPGPEMDALRSFVIYGAPYAFPPVRVGTTLGFPTAHGTSPLAGKVALPDEPHPVWPHAEGTVRGPGLLPLYENLPLAARDDPSLYELLALFDGLRAGQTREWELVRSELSKRLVGDLERENDPMDSQDELLEITKQVRVPRAALEDLVRRYHIRRLALFGSAARGELTADSDIDLMVEFEPGEAPSLWSSDDLRNDIVRLFGGRPVDIVPPEVLRNPYRRKTIQRDLKVLYEAA